MTWNYRILEINDYYSIMEVHYDEDGELYAYSESAPPVGGEDIEAIEWTLRKMLEAIEKPVLTMEDFNK